MCVMRSGTAADVGVGIRAGIVEVRIEHASVSTVVPVATTIQATQ